MLVTYVVAALTFAIAYVYFVECSSTAADVCYEHGIPLKLNCVSAWRVVLPKFSKGEDCCSV